MNKRKIFSLLLIGIFSVTMITPVFAEGNNHSINVTNGQTDEFVSDDNSITTTYKVFRNVTEPEYDITYTWDDMTWTYVEETTGDTHTDGTWYRGSYDSIAAAKASGEEVLQLDLSEEWGNAIENEKAVTVTNNSNRNINVFAKTSSQDTTFLLMCGYKDASTANIEVLSTDFVTLAGKYQSPNETQKYYFYPKALPNIDNLTGITSSDYTSGKSYSGSITLSFLLGN